MINVSEYVSIKRTFEKKYNEHQIEVKVTKDLVCKNWAIIGGELENLFVDPNLKQVNTLKFNLSDCSNIDPFPMMLIILFLKKVKIKLNKKIVILLPTNGKNFDYSKGLLLKTLATDGFLTEMLNEGFIVKSRQCITEQEITKYVNYNHKIDYSIVFPIKTYSISSLKQKDSIIKDIESRVALSLQNTMSARAFDTLSMQIYNIMNELIENVYNHAYPNENEKTFAIYIRKRNGAIKDYFDESNLEETKKQLKKEESHCPGLNNSVIEKNENILEVFFVDIGIGLRGSLKNYYMNYIRKDYKYPIKETFIQILNNGIRSQQRTETTKYGGLHFLGRLLKESGGHLWCNEACEWINLDTNELSLTPKKQNGKFQYFGSCEITTNNKKIYSDGLSLCFRVPYSETRQLDSNNLTEKWNGQPDEHPVYKIYKYNDSYQDMNLRNLICKDDKQNKTFYLDGHPNEWNETFENLKKTNTYSVVWFPKQNIAKNTIYKNIDDILDIFDSEKFNTVQPIFFIDHINIIIGDLDYSDIISYYYVLNNLEVTNKKCCINDVILITKQWEVVFFKNDGGFLKIHRQKAANFVTSNLYNNICDSLAAYALFLRKYYSYFFWKKIANKQEENYYINANIKWGEKNTINGYLDFERVTTDNELLYFLELALYRTLGYFNTNDVEYKSTDYISRRICQDMNYNIMDSDFIKYVVYILTVCVTGYTQKAQYNYDEIFDGRYMLHTAFFANPNSKLTSISHLKDISFLYIWPSEEFFDIFPKTEKNYYRIGKTSLISEEEICSRIEIDKIYMNSVCNDVEMYEEIQQNYPAFLKYGHYCTDKHHYLISLDLITYMKNCYLKKSGGFLYLLWKSYLFLVNNKESLFEDIADIEWRHNLKNVNYRNKNVGSLIVYHSNTFTDYFMTRVKDILPLEMSQRIIPITFFETQSFGTTVSISPFTLNQIKNKLSSETSKEILYIDSSFSTGRRMTEVENILLSIGCTKVNFLTITDMRRLKSFDKKTEAYWKLNVPRLDDNSSCLLCSSLKQLNDFKVKVDKELINRIDYWIKEWQVTNITSSLKNHGIKTTTIDKFNDELNITQSTALNVFVAEQLSETYNNDMVYFLTQNQSNFSTDIRIQLICTQLCLFGNQNSRQLQLSLLSELIGNMAKKDNSSAYTSLGGLVLISQNASVFYDLINEILYENANRKILSIKENMLNCKNMDLIIVFCYFVKKSHQIEILLNEFNSLVNHEYPLIKNINEHILPEKELKLITKELLGLLVNEQGSDHGTNINKFKNENIIGLEAMKRKGLAAKNDIFHMNELKNRIPLSMANGRSSLNRERFKQNTETILKIQEYINKEIIEYGDIIQRNNNSTYNMSVELKNSINECKDFFMEFVKGYLIDSSSSIEYIKSIIQNTMDKTDKKIGIMTQNNLHYGQQVKWYYWNQGIEKEFIYLLQNITHCEKTVENDLYMLVEILYNDDFIVLRTISWSKLPASGVKEHFLKKNRLSKEQALSFDVVFDFEDLSEYTDGYYLLRSQITIPSCFQTLKGVDNNARS